ncbi:MAG: aminotransferase class III-fold pyridoxal phosphate-dependent enzyme, partial [Actinomycetia bacterium]|nr:aminotransferase class III-fold pyridoxal phosphate-dependent enzyme [Actinomycetes bacterium]
APKYLKRGKGCRVWDVDGNEYIDYGMGLGPIILGYCYEAVDRAIEDQLKDATILTQMHPLEVEVARLLVDVIPCAEMIRYGKNGSDVTSAAVRLARTYTGRDIIACSGYHGWQDWYIGITEKNAGVPEAVRNLTKKFKYNDIDSLKKIFKEHKNNIACVIMEPMGAVFPENDFLNKVKELTHKNDAVLIFDEVITGFRWSLGGAQEYFSVVPDLATFGKAMANGMPLSALVGSKKIMQKLEDVFFSFTFGGEILSLAAAKATINEMRERNVMSHIHKMGTRLTEGCREIIKKYGLESYIRLAGPDFRSIFFFDDRENGNLHKSLLQQEMIKRGINFTGYNNICYSHKEKDIDETIIAFNESAGLLSNWIKEGSEERMLEGKIVRPVFKRY